MNIGRNEPCPCGSGKKYKLCCINKSNADFDSIAAATTKSSQSCDNSDSILEELFGRYIFEGYEFSGKGKPIEACELFLKAWEEIRHQIRPEDRSTKRLND